ncbi:LacI family transcriptional regulator [Paenibacillus turicensis]|uniref:LacI family transcriptional regulator n=2 Tax=Paenibacillus turicensis TaxID=160487 RepID=A0ABS4FNX9_9BACL|nr:LacI family transcriptional regulator [Paenibacillus turicensis]
MMKNNITMRDIANKLGVSTVTVSKALSDKEGVSDELKLKIKQLAAQMGYRYNTTAKAMKEGLSHNIGVIIPERFTGLAQSFYLIVYKQISLLLEQAGYFGILSILSDQDEEQLQIPKIYAEKKVDGLIILGQISKGYIQLVQEMDLPKVFLDFYDEHSDIDAIVTDNFYGAYELTNYLISQGHTKIAYVGNINSTSSIQDRYLGYYKSLLEHNIKLDENLVISDRDERGKYIELELPNSDLPNSPQNMPTAFVCNCDQIAYLLIQKLNSKGYAVPKDCSVVGFDNDIYATIATPHLTTMEVNFEQMSSIAVKYIIDKISSPSLKLGRVLVQGNIIHRDSVQNVK